MKNDVILKKDRFPKTIAEACHVLSKWKNNYSKFNNAKNESNDGIDFATVTHKKKLTKARRKGSPASNVKRKDTTQMNVLPKNCLRHQK